MSTPTPRPAAGSRPSVAHATALLVLSLIVAASIDPLRPIAREVQRETAPERAAVRELTATLAKAVRSLCGSPTVKPVSLAAVVSIGSGGGDARCVGRFAAHRASAPGPVRLRVALLDLPPPVRA